jgi:hypothetical protein
VNRSRDPKAPHLVLVNGTKIFLGSAEIPSSLEGTNLAWEWLDEARYYRKKAWEILVGRARLAGAKRIQKVLTSTPAAGWLQEQFDAGGVAGHALVRVSTRENACNLDADFIPTLERTYSKRLAQALIEGRFVASENAVYESFDFENIHGVEWSYREGLRTVVVIDFGKRRPAVTFWQQPEILTPLPGTAMGDRRVALDDTWICFDELHPEQITTPKLAGLILGRAKERKYKLHEAFVDPAGRATQAVTGLSDIDIIEGQLPCSVSWCGDPILRFIPNGIDLVDGRLLNSRDETRFYVAKQLAGGGTRGIVNGYKSYSYRAPKNDQPVSDHPVKDGVTEHVMDTTRYLAINLEQRNRDGDMPASSPR